MKLHELRAIRSLSRLGVIGCLSVLAGCSGSGSTGTPQNTQMTTRFQQTNLVSDLSGVAASTDANLINPWGITLKPGGPFWIADNGSGKSTLYNGAGTAQSPVVIIPSPTTAAGGTPTGLVFNSTTDFQLANGSPAQFLFATEDGTIVGWNGADGTNAELVADRSSIPFAGAGAVYKGLAIGSNPSGNFLYAANFRAGTVDVFDTNFRLVLLAGPFIDPGLPTGFAPFGIQNVGGDIYVTYAKQDADKHNDVGGAGSGLIDDFDSNGNFKRRFATGSAAGGTLAALNSPWGMAVAPAGFGAFGSALLVGNFGDGHISAFNINSGAFLGQLQAADTGNPVTIPGLWGLTFGSGGSAGTSNSLFFTAGIGDPPTYVANRQHHGLFGSLQIVPQ